MRWVTLRSRTLFATTLLMALASAHVARADATTEAAALKQFEAGRAAFDQQDYAAALTAFTASLQGLPSPNTRLYIARCQRALGRTASAYTSYRLAAREATDRLNATGEKRYAATKEAAAAEAAEIEKSVPHLEIRLPADAPPTTIVKLDDVELAHATLGSLDVDPGPHVVVASAPRRTTFHERVDLAAGERKKVDVSLARVPTATVQLVFTTKPSGIAVEIDGHAVEPSSIDRVQELDVGAHRVLVRAPGYRDFEWSQTLANGDARRVEVKLAPGAGAASAGTPRWLFFGVAALGAAALGTGAYFAIDATSRANAEKGKDPLVRDRLEQDAIKSAATTANVLFISGAAIAGGAIALFFITDWSGDNPAKKRMGRIEPLLGPFGAGARGTF